MNHSESGGEREDGETKTSTLEEILKQEPLRHIDWTQLKKDRDDATVRLFQEFAVRRRNMFTETSVPLSEERAHGATCTIRTIEENPEIHAGYRPCPPEDAKFMREEVMRLAASRLVGPSTAGYSNHPMIVHKTRPRIMLDLRNLNKKSLKDDYPMPKIQDLTDQLHGAIAAFEELKKIICSNPMFLSRTGADHSTSNVMRATKV
jgi:hypothetical protein